MTSGQVETRTAASRPRYGLSGFAFPVWRVAVVALVLLLAAAIAISPAPSGMPQQSMVALGLVVMTVVFWATLAIPPAAAAMMFTILVLATRAAPPQAAVSGFLSSSLWLVFGGLLIGVAAERTGFGRFIARKFLGRFRSSYSALVLGVIVGTTMLTFLVPSNMGRLAITVPVVLALANDAGYRLGSNGHIGLVLIAVVGNFGVGQGVLPANLLNIMIIGAGETLYGIIMTYVHYFLLCAPVLGIAKAFLVWRLLIRIHPAPVPRSDEAGSKADQLSPEAKRVGILLALAILLWATDFWHGLKPGWVALLVGALCVMPGIGVLPAREIANPRRLLIIIWVGTVLSLASVMTESGASTLVSSALARLTGVEGQGAAYGYFVMAYLSSLVSVLATFGGAVPIMATVAAEISNATGLPLETAVMAIAPGMSAMFFPYIASPFVVGLAMGHVSHRAALPFMVTLALVTCAVIIPLNALWWWAIGMLP